MADEKDRCVLCLDKKRSPVRITCGHSFCHECLDVYKSYSIHAWANRCPICRTTLKEKRSSVNRPLHPANEPVHSANEPVHSTNEPVHPANEPLHPVNEPVHPANEPPYVDLTSDNEPEPDSTVWEMEDFVSVSTISVLDSSEDENEAFFSDAEVEEETTSFADDYEEGADLVEGEEAGQADNDDGIAIDDEHVADEYWYYGENDEDFDYEIEDDEDENDEDDNENDTVTVASDDCIIIE